MTVFRIARGCWPTGSARLRLNNLATAGDELVLTWVARYVHAFLRSWESAGHRDTKQVVPSQLTHTAGVSYRVQGRVLAITSTIEMHNLTNARTFDFFGAQRPGRGVFAKMVVEY